MSLQSFQETLVCSAGAGPQLSNSTTATSLLKTSDVITLPPCFFDRVGKALRISGMAEVSNVVTTPGTLTIDVRLGAVIAYTSSAMQMSTTAHTSLPLFFQILLVCRAIGSGTSANIMGIGKYTGQVLVNGASADSTVTMGTLISPATAPAVGTGFNSTSSNTLDLFGKFSVSTNPTNITLHQYLVESLN